MKRFITEHWLAISVLVIAGLLIYSVCLQLPKTGDTRMRTNVWGWRQEQVLTVNGWQTTSAYWKD